MNVVLHQENVNANSKTHLGGFPGGTVVKNPPANAVDMDSIPGPGRSHMPRSKLSPCTTTTEPACHN